MKGAALIKRPITAIALGALWLYQKSLSPVFYFLGARCRHVPTCSEYSADAFRRHGPWAGFWLTFSRLSRCHPFGSHGWDPAPEDLPRARWRFWRLGDWAWTERKPPASLCVSESLDDAPVLVDVPPSEVLSTPAAAPAQPSRKGDDHG